MSGETPIFGDGDVEALRATIASGPLGEKFSVTD
jgi:hypothetical protein